MVLPAAGKILMVRHLIFSLKLVLAFLLTVLGIVRLYRFLNRKRIKILLYHGVVKAALEPTLNSEALHLEAGVFDRQIAYLKRHYRIIALQELVDGMQGRKDLPEYAVALTFDDGYRNTYESAWPILQRHQVPAAFFVTTSFISSRELLWLDQLEYAVHASAARRVRIDLASGPLEHSLASKDAKRTALSRLKRLLKVMPAAQRRAHLAELHRQLAVATTYREGYFCNPLDWEHVGAMASGRHGVEFGSHAVRHENLDTLEQPQMQQEVVESKAILESRLGIPVEGFAYPGGAWNEAIKQALIGAGYRYGLTTRHGFNDRSTDLFELRRNEVGHGGNLVLFGATVSGALDALKALFRQGG